MDQNKSKRLDEVNDSLSLIQDTEGLTFGTDALLLAGYIGKGYKLGLELGGGTGIISMLLLSRGKLERCICAEIQKEYAELIRENAAHNSLEDRLECINADIREHRFPECDIVYTNPPYMKADTGKRNITDKKNIARHEVNGSILDFCMAAKRSLKFGGTLAVVYRPDRCMDLLAAMREAGIEPKRMTFVHADTASEPSMMLVEGKRGGKSGMRVTAPLIIYRDRTHTAYGEDMEYIMENGIFPDNFFIK